MKLVGLQKIDGGLLIAVPSGQQLLMALPDDRMRAALLLGERLLDVLDDPDEPHAKQGLPHGSEVDSELQESLAAVEAGIEAGRLVWHTLRLVSRGRR